MNTVKKTIMLFVCFFFCYNAVFSQQLPLFSQYMFNDFVLNPAIAGSRDNMDIRLTYRNQWTGFEGAPETETLSFHTRLKETNNSLGGMVFNDVTGPSRRTGINLAYAYRLLLFNKVNASFGLSGGVFQYQVDGSKMTTAEPNDNAVPLTSENIIVPDASFGVYLYTDDYYAGFSVPQLFETKAAFSDAGGDQIGSLARHYTFLGGFYFKANATLSIEPSVLVKAVKASPIQIDINSKFHFQNKFWLGLSYRTGDAFAVLAGLKIKNRFHLGYSYDLTLTELRFHSGGSHEIMLGYHLFKEKSPDAVLKFM